MQMNMRHAMMVVAATVACAIATPAGAGEWYGKVGATVTNATNLDIENVGGVVEGGWRGEWLAVGLEASQLCRQSQCDLSAGVNGYLYPLSLGPVDTYLVAGGGVTNHPGAEVYIQAGIGAEVGLTDVWSLYGEGRMRWNHSDVDAIIDFDNYHTADGDITIIAGIIRQF